MGMLGSFGGAAFDPEALVADVIGVNRSYATHAVLYIVNSPSGSDLLHVLPNMQGIHVPKLKI